MEMGFEEAELFKFGADDYRIRALSERHMLTMEEFAMRLSEVGNVEEAARAYQLIGEVYQESTPAATLWIPKIVCVACKSTQGNARVQRFGRLLFSHCVSF